MSNNSLSSLNISLITSPLHSTISSLFEDCQESIASNIIFSIYTFITVILLPLYILVLSVGAQRWRHQRSMSHSDVFTYHIVAVEILVVLGSFVYCLGIYTNNIMMLMLGMFMSCITFPGQTLFHLLTCVDRYLAVVHPITYIRLRERGAVRIRNISIVCVWLLCFGWIGVTKVHLPNFAYIPLLCMLSISIVVIFLCCQSVLCVLTCSGPGEVGGTKERVDRSKQRAFHIISAILGVLLLRFVGLLVTFCLSYLQMIQAEDLCAVMDFGIILTVPSSLVMPLLFLHKAGKLACCRQNTE